MFVFKQSVVVTGQNNVFMAPWTPMLFDCYSPKHLYFRNKKNGLQVEDEVKSTKVNLYSQEDSWILVPEMSC